MVKTFKNLKKGLVQLTRGEVLSISIVVLFIVLGIFLATVRSDAQVITQYEENSPNTFITTAVEVATGVTTETSTTTKVTTKCSSTNRTSTTATSREVTTSSTKGTTKTTEAVTTTAPPKSTIKTTTTTTEVYLVFNPDSKRVHKSNCKYADSSMERVKNNYVEEGRKCTHCNPDVEIGTVYKEPVTTSESSSSYSSNGMTYYSQMQGTYYTSSLGTRGSYGSLTSGYSVAINGIAGGTIVYIESNCPGVGGYYQVMDTGGMGYGVVDFFYTEGCVPSEFAWRGRISLTVYICN